MVVHWCPYSRAKAWQSNCYYTGERLQLSIGVNIIGFDVQPAERAGVEAIAKAGKGTYYHADSATKFAEVVQALHKQLETKVAAAPADRATKEFKAAGKDAKPGAFLNDAPLVKPGEYKGTLAMMDAHYYQVPVHKGQELRAVGIVQKTPYEVGYSKPYQSFIVTIYDQNFSVAAREADGRGKSRDSCHRAGYLECAGGRRGVCGYLRHRQSRQQRHSPCN